MKRIQKVLFVLATVVALVGAEAAFAQVQFQSTGGLKLVRAEGHNEVVSAIDMVAQNTGDVTDTTSITISFAGDITNNFDVIAEGDLVLCDEVGDGTGVCDGDIVVTVDGSEMVIDFTATTTFTGLAGRITIEGVRVDVADFGAGDISATISSSGDPSGFRVTYTDPIVLVARARNSLDIEIESSDTGLLLCDPPGSIGASAVTFTATVGEQFGAVFTSDAQEGAAGIDPAEVDQGTQIVFTLSGVNAELSVFADIIDDDTGVATIVDDTQDSDGDDLEFVVRFAAATDLGASEEFVIEFTIYLNTGDELTLETSTVNLAVALGPVDDFDEDDPEVILFADNGVNQDVAAINDCVTRLLYSWAVNIAGFETGIAISNTSEDDLAYETSGEDKFSAVAQDGSCSLTGYPSADADGDPTTSPTAGAPVQFTTGIIPAGTSEAFVISGLPGFSGFRGYILAVCNFLNAHSFAFITDGFGSAGGPTLAQGFQALVVGGTGSRVVSGGESAGQ